MKDSQYPIHERLPFASLLTMAAGSLDAYSYLAHGQVFAGLQTGNLILFGIHLGRLEFANAFHYVLSILAFFVGTILIRILQYRFADMPTPVYRQRWILTGAIIFLMIGWGASYVAPSIVVIMFLSMAAAAELQEFRKLKGAAFTPLMMTGNLRKLAEASFDSIFYKKVLAYQRVKDTTIVLISFAVGALLSGLAVLWLHVNAIVLPILILISAIIVLNHGYNN
ncbi:YoaK family protein [Apilactobacillus xinyiensis]|uniref:YoaK family protein n=1 Tax=Apilactobacillus xinyiensis TaxID=2841032 RepID=UPI0024B1E7AC|nr:YoaK family protein [Apilactobacillus xinyiensis]